MALAIRATYPVVLTGQVALMALAIRSMYPVVLIGQVALMTLTSSATTTRL
ncbi:MAG: hypothetical protein KKB51_10045 [Candidatus Riflebacteria bacterium]|nr:hypothetical protein [Candidatus Riflebacteria bacterium]